MVIDMSWTTTDKTKAVTTNESAKGQYALRKEAMLQQIKESQENNKSYLCLGIWGEPKSAKSATAMDLRGLNLTFCKLVVSALGPDYCLRF